MATILLGAAGSALGASLGGGILGVSAVTIGGMIGATAGSMVDSWIVSSMTPGQRIEGARMDSLRMTSATEGVVIPRLYGRMRVGGNIIWATDFREEVNTTRQGGGKGGGPKVTTTCRAAAWGARRRRHGRGGALFRCRIPRPYPPPPLAPDRTATRGLGCAEVRCGSGGEHCPAAIQHLYCKNLFRK